MFLWSRAGPVHKADNLIAIKTKNKQTPFSESANKLSRPSDTVLSAKLVPTFANRGCRVVSATDPQGRILGVLDRSRYYFQVAPQLYSRGWVDHVTSPPSVSRLSRRCGILNNPQPYRPLRPVAGIASLFENNVYEIYDYKACHYVILSILLLHPNSSFIFFLPFSLMQLENIVKQNNKNRSCVHTFNPGFAPWI
jgi:hypothetical protein